MYDFNYHRPATVSAAVRLFGEVEDGVYLAGGHTLIPSMKHRLAAPTDVIDLAGIGELSGIEQNATFLAVGALSCHEEVAMSPSVRSFCPALCDLAWRIGDAQVRNRGTIGGSVSNNDPAADYPAALLALGADIATDRRRISADDFFKGMFQTALEEGEIITAVNFPRPRAAAYAKFPNPASRYATVGVFVAEFGEGVRVAITGAAPVVFRAAEMEAALMADFSSQALDGIFLDASGMNDDLHASAEYRAHLCTVMAKRAVASSSETGRVTS